MKKLVLLFCSFIFLSLHAQRTVGLLTQTEGSAQGYVLFAPLSSKTTYLIDKCGKQVHSWKSNYAPGQSVYLLPTGNLLRTANDSNKVFSGGGRIELFDWNNKLVWNYVISDSLNCQHHDVFPLSNGNILVIVWEKISREEAIAAGRDPKLLGPFLWSEKIVELKPKGKNKAKLVWQWRVWDHLIQDFDSSKANYGIVAENPQRININFNATTDIDWLHFNSVSHNPSLNQIIISNRNHSEIYIIDHSTSLQQAASKKGGKQNKGGDLLYRWGNPQSYMGAGKEKQQLFRQHSAYWIEPSLNDGGKIMLFNNGLGRPDTMYSSVEIINPPLTATGGYKIEKGFAFEPIKPFWTYLSENPMDFFSKNVSSAQRLKNGNTLICSGARGRLFEIDKNKKTVWVYINPISFSVPQTQGMPAGQNLVFRCLFYEADYEGLKGKILSPGALVEEGPSDYPCFLQTPEEFPKRR